MCKLVKKLPDIVSLFSVASIVVFMLCSCFGDVNQLTTNRDIQLEEVRKARSNIPVNTALLTDRLLSPDWYVAALAADALGEAQKSDRLTIPDRAIVISSLESSLARPQHWWRLGWDRDDAAVFRGAVAYALAQFGSEAIPSIVRMLGEPDPQKQEGACYALVAMLDDQVVTAEELDNQIRHQVNVLADTSKYDDVQNACSRAKAQLSKHETEKREAGVEPAFLASPLGHLTRKFTCSCCQGCCFSIGYELFRLHTRQFLCLVLLKCPEARPYCFSHVF